MTHVDYKALGSLPRVHETLIPIKQLVNNIFFDAMHRGEKANALRLRAPGGYKGGGEGSGENDEFTKVFLNGKFIFFLLIIYQFSTIV